MNVKQLTRRLEGLRDKRQYRLGALLINRGALTHEDLQNALDLQKQTGTPLGTILTDAGIIKPSILHVTLGQQLILRAVAASVAFVIGFSSMIPQTALATSSTLSSEQRAAAARSYPEGQVERISLNPNPGVKPERRQQLLFDTPEIRSTDISPFTKWTDVRARLNSRTAALPESLKDLANASFADKVTGVNAYFNKMRYIEDKNNWGTSDYWATPKEFEAKGGDCEDFAIAKYAALKSLGIAESQLRVAIVQDTWKGIPHAILVVYGEDGIKLLDNQYKDVKDAEGFDRYRPIYSINRTAWWRHIT